MFTQGFILGVDHHRTPVGVRERLAALPDDFFSETFKKAGVHENMLLSTCNRYEIYGAADCHGIVPGAFAMGLEKAGLSSHDVLPYLYHKTGESMLRHGFAVASSLESMVLGEPQILGQMKQAWQRAQERGSSGGFLERFCAAAFHVGKRVRTETDIAREQVSIASMAVKVAQQIFGSFDDVSVLLVGAGEMGISAARSLKNAGVARVTVTSRTLERAAQTAVEVGAHTAPWDGLEEAITAADVVITSTASSAPILTVELMQGIMKTRRGRPLFLIDIAVPRDVAEGVSQLNGCFVYDIDQLGKLSEKARKQRSASIEDARQIIEDEVGRFLAWSLNREQLTTVLRLRDHFHKVREDVLSRGNLSAEEATRLLVNKLLHTPTRMLKEAGDPALEKNLRKLFDLTEPS